jgi:poly-D-alanine transfer protein DltD
MARFMIISVFLRRSGRFLFKKLSEEVSKYGFPSVDFQNYEMDKCFTCNLASHQGRVGWVYVDETLDAFYHNTLLIPVQKTNPDPPVILGGQD